MQSGHATVFLASGQWQCDNIKEFQGQRKYSTNVKVLVFKWSRHNEYSNTAISNFKHENMVTLWRQCRRVPSSVYKFPRAGGDAKKLIEKEREIMLPTKKLIAWTAVHRNSKIPDYIRLVFGIKIFIIVQKSWTRVADTDPQKHRIKIRILAAS